MCIGSDFDEVIPETPDTPEIVSVCVGGVFMQNGSNDHHSPLNEVHTKKLRFAPEVTFENQTLDYGHEMKENYQQSEDLFDCDDAESVQSTKMSPSTPKNLFGPSVDENQSEKINLTKIIEALMSQKPQPILDSSEKIVTSEICDLKNTSADELIRAHANSQVRIDRLIVEIQDSS